MIKKFESIVFDVDGTLINSNTASLKSLQKERKKNQKLNF